MTFLQGESCEKYITVVTKLSSLVGMEDNELILSVYKGPTRTTQVARNRG